MPRLRRIVCGALLFLKIYTEVFLKSALLVSLAVLGLGAVLPLTAQAAGLHCEGNYLFHDFTIDGSVSGAHVPGQVRFVISQGGSTVKNGLMTVTQSSIQPGKSIQLMAKSSDGSTGDLNAAFEPDSGNYTGTLNAHGSQGSVSVSVECVLGNSLAPQDNEVYW